VGEISTSVPHVYNSPLVGNSSQSDFSDRNVKFLVLSRGYSGPLTNRNVAREII